MVCCLALMGRVASSTWWLVTIWASLLGSSRAMTSSLLPSQRMIASVRYMLCCSPSSGLTAVNSVPLKTESSRT